MMGDKPVPNTIASSNGLLHSSEELGLYKNSLGIEELLKPGEDNWSLFFRNYSKKILKNSKHANNVLEDTVNEVDRVQNYSEKFYRIELDGLCKLYKKVTNCSGQQQVGQSIGITRRTQSRQTMEGIDRNNFRDLLHNTFNTITEDTLIERMFCYWDRENEGIIRLEPWIIGLDVFLRGSLREKTEFCFKVYDLNNDGFITKDEIFQLFKNCLIKQPGEEDPDEGVRDLSELTLKKLDVDRDGKISFLDYKQAVKEEPLLLEAFGQCLPTDESCASFLASLQP